MSARNRGSRFESTVRVLILLSVAGMAGAASFTHVHDWTMHNSPAGTGDWFGWANAMVSELIPLAAGLEARRRIRTAGRAGAYPIALIVGAVALSLTGQFAEAQPSFSGWLISAVPALGFLALVKLVLSGPTTATDCRAKVSTPTTTATDHSAADVPAAVVVPAIAIDPMPTQLLPVARYTAINHQHTTGQMITVTELAERLHIAPVVATRLLAMLDDETRLNGHALGGAR